MSINCCVCEKKQSGWITDYPISNHLPQFRICVNCNEKLNKLMNTRTACNNNEEIEYFKKMLDSNEMDTSVSEYLNKAIVTCNNLIDGKTVLEAMDKAIKEEQARSCEVRQEAFENYLMTSGYDFQGYSISQYVKVICAEVVLGTGFLSEFTASFADFFGVESERFAGKLEQARNIATDRLIEKAINLGANAIIGIDFDYTMFGANIIAVIVNGTAVVVQKNI